MDSQHKPLPEVWALTTAERERLAAAPFPMDPEHWRWFAATMHEHALEGYQAGELDFRTLLTYTRACALGCTLKDRITLTALMVERGLAVTPKTLKRRRPPYPRWVQQAAGELVRALEGAHPGEAVAPSSGRDGSSPILHRALGWLTTVGLVDPAWPLRPLTLYKWYLARQKAAGVALRRWKRARSRA